MLPREKIHQDKLFMYRKREAEARAALGEALLDKAPGYNPDVDRKLNEDAEGWARLRIAREAIKMQMDDLAESMRRIGAS